MLDLVYIIQTVSPKLNHIFPLADIICQDAREILYLIVFSLKYILLLATETTQ